MHKEILFWIGVWAIAAVGGVSRASRDRDYNDLSSLVSVGLFSGLVGFGTVSVIVGSLHGYIGSELRYLGISALLGLMGKEQDKLIRFVIRKMFLAMGVIDSGNENGGISRNRMGVDWWPDNSDTDSSPTDGDPRE